MAPDYDPTEFQTVLRTWMDRNALSQMAAGHTIGVSPGIINRWLKPRDDPYLVKPTIDSLEKLAPILRVSLIQLKRMTDNLSPADLAVLTALEPEPPDHRLDVLVREIREQWRTLDEDGRQQAEDVTRVAFRLHHNRVRKSRERRASKEEGDNSRLGNLTAA